MPNKLPLDQRNSYLHYLQNGDLVSAAGFPKNIQIAAETEKWILEQDPQFSFRITLKTSAEKFKGELHDHPHQQRVKSYYEAIEGQINDLSILNKLFQGMADSIYSTKNQKNNKIAAARRLLSWHRMRYRASACAVWRLCGESTFRTRGSVPPPSARFRITGLRAPSSAVCQGVRCGSCTASGTAATCSLPLPVRNREDTKLKFRLRNQGGSSSIVCST